MQTDGNPTGNRPRRQVRSYRPPGPLTRLRLLWLRGWAGLRDFVRTRLTGTSRPPVRGPSAATGAEPTRSWPPPRGPRSHSAHRATGCAWPVHRYAPPSRSSSHAPWRRTCGRHPLRNRGPALSVRPRAAALQWAAQGHRGARTVYDCL